MFRQIGERFKNSFAKLKFVAPMAKLAIDSASLGTTKRARSPFRDGKCMQSHIKLHKKNKDVENRNFYNFGHSMRDFTTSAVCISWPLEGRSYRAWKPLPVEINQASL